METEIAIFIGSIISLGIGISLWQKGSELMIHGKKAEAIVYKNNYSPDAKGGVYYPVVRFLTDKKVWITQELSIGYNPPLEEGIKLEVVYDPDEPTIVEINEQFQLAILPRVLTAIGVCGLIVLILQLFDVIQFF